MNEGKGKIYGCTVCNALGYRLMQLAAKRMGNEGLHIWRGAISLLAIGYTFGVRKVRSGSVETRKRKVSSKVSSKQPTNQPPSNQTNQPVKKTKVRRPRVGAKEILAS
jgi:hypothetical protein